MVAALVLALAAALAGEQMAGFPLSLGSCALEGAKPGELRSVYWELYQHTEVCVSFPAEPASSSLALTFSFTHVGRALEERPRHVLMRAQLPPGAAVLRPSLSLLVDGREALDLTGPGALYQTTYPPHCTPPPETGCSFTGVEAAIPTSVFERIAEARTLEGRAFGAGFALSPAQRARVAALAARLRLRVSRGVSIAR
jgi:hypothetical protein